MLISCPKCIAVYDVATDKIPEQGRQFKCIECGNVWTVFPQDVKDIEPENKIKTQLIVPDKEEMVQNDVQEMFKRLSHNTDDLFAGVDKYTTQVTTNRNYTKQPQWASDRTTTLGETTKRKMQVFFSPLMLNGLLTVLIVVLTMYIGYFHRYEIVRFAPVAENFYNNMKIDSLYTGRDIIFDHLNVKPLVRGHKHFVEVSGRLLNHGKYRVKLPSIKAVLRNAEGTVLTEETKDIPLHALTPQASSIFFFVLENKTPEAKVVNLSFVPHNHQ